MAKNFYLVVVGVGVILLALAHAQQPPAREQLPGRVPMGAHMLKPPPEWIAYYDVVPDGERALYWTAKALAETARQNIARMDALEKRTAELEKKVAELAPAKAVEPNQPARAVEPNKI